MVYSEAILTAKPLKRESQNDGSEWAERCGYWLKALEAGKAKTQAAGKGNPGR